jgi:hypothetical protein
MTDFCPVYTSPLYREERASFVSKLYFMWVTAIVRLGYGRPLEV